MRIAALLIAAGAFLAAAAQAADVKVYTVAAFQPVVQAMAPAFEKRTGHRLKIVDDDFDLVVLPAAELETLGREGVVNENSITQLARQRAAVISGAVAVGSANSNAALSLLILLSSEETQRILKDKGFSAP